MKTQAQMTQEFNDIAIQLGLKTVKRLRPSKSQTVEQKLDVMVMNFNIWLEENPEKDEHHVLPNSTPLAQPEEPANQKEVEEDFINRLHGAVKKDDQKVIEMNNEKNYRGGSAKEVVYSCMHEGDKVAYIISEAVSLGLTKTQAKQALNNIVFKDKVAHLA